MNLQTIHADIKKLEKAAKLIEQTENYMHFSKLTILLDVLEQVNVLRDKADKQIQFIQLLNNN